MRRRNIPVIAAAALITSLLAAACSSSGASNASNSPNGPVHITFLAIPPANTTIPTVVRDVFAGFKKTHPGSTLTETYIGQNLLDQKLQLLSAQDALPEMFVGPGTPASQQQMGDKGLSLNIGDALAKLGVSGQIKPVAAKILEQQQGGHLYALPFDLAAEGIWYNKKMFTASGITPPATWDGLVNAANTLHARGIQPFAASGLQGWPITRLVGDLLMRKLGPDALRKVADGQAKLTDPQYVQAAQDVLSLGKKGYFGNGVVTLDYTPAENLFLQGKAAMYYMGSWAVADFNNPALNKIGAGDVGFFPFPAVPGGAGSIDQTPMNAGQPIMFSKKAYTPAVAQWLKYLVQNYGSVALSKESEVSGFVVDSPPASLSPTTQLTLNQIAATKTPVLWFEALFSAQATTVSQQNAAELANGTLSAQAFMSKVQTAIDSSK
jgi:raffinose/stachyose/melibiose transport system substrate-binding protein